ncbi:MAG: bacillithiol biosynthesis cysteine-adding enzyme BshC, partial [Chitinophagaceae bacterium]
MAFSAKHISIKQSGFFTTIINDYVDGEAALKEFYIHPVNVDGIKAAIKERSDCNFDRKLINEVLSNQYSKVGIHPEVQKNLALLSDENTFTVCTAHQPNIFTGHLYFVYKILHAVRLAESLSKNIEGKNFVPVFYMGSEDADLEELGTIEVGGKTYRWNTGQKGAVGRMKVDNKLISLIDEISSQVSVQPYGVEIVQLLRNAYRLGETIEVSTFRLVNELFGRFGLIILLPDSKSLKGSFEPVLRKELEDEFSGKAVRSTLQRFPEKYKVQAGGRSINLFYLEDQIRERIERTETGFAVNNSALSFSKSEIENELKNNPESFSPNVILRPVYQEWILPNVAFIGGGGEIAYWLELKEVFRDAGVPMPVLVLRNSFMIVPEKLLKVAEKWNLQIED